MAITPDMTFWINGVIFNKLIDICPDLNLNGDDRKLYLICIKDFKDYSDYLNRNFPKENTKQKPVDVPQTVAEEILSFVFESANGGLPKSLQSTQEITEFLGIWVKWWWRKWKERTKVILNDKDLPKTAIVSLNIPAIASFFTPEEYEDIMNAMTDKLMRYGEICCTSIIADSLFKKEVQDAQKKEWTLQEKLGLLTKLQRRAKEVAYTHGPLVYLKLNKDYKMGEWRNDGAIL